MNTDAALGQHNDTLLSLDDVGCTDPAVAGAKAAWLARAIQAGMPVVPGLVVPASASRRHLEIGSDALGRRGSGGARLEVSRTELSEPFASDLVRASGDVGDPLVVRSSSLLEDGGAWSGAFTSYLEVHPAEVPRAVAGCWASVFGVSTLERYTAAGREPGSVPMAVLIQAALNPKFGGTARLDSEDILLVAVAGSPAPLVQGWKPGTLARVDDHGRSTGAGVELIGEDLVGQVAGTLRRARDSVGATACEWAVDDGVVYLLQLMAPEVSRPPATMSTDPALERPEALELGRLTRRYPGPLGESLILPWAVGSPNVFLDPVSPVDADPAEAWAVARDHAATLTAQVWSMPKPAATSAAQETLRGVRGSDPGPALDRLTRLRTPDMDRAQMVLGLMATVGGTLVELGAITWPETVWHLDPGQIPNLLSAPSPAPKRVRIGFDRWEPFGAAVTLAGGEQAAGTSAAPGIAAGRMCHISDPGRTDHFRPRDVVVAPYPTPHLAALLWDAAAVVTTGGSPAAHLFESARALAMPAVCGVHLDEVVGGPVAGANRAFALAVDGSNGTVNGMDW